MEESKISRSSAYLFLDLFPESFILNRVPPPAISANNDLSLTLPGFSFSFRQGDVSVAVWTDGCRGIRTEQ